MNRMLTATLCVLLTVLLSAPALAGTNYFRQHTISRQGDEIYFVPIASIAANKNTGYVVETDGSGRMTTVKRYYLGKLEWTDKYRYEGQSPYSAGFTSYGEDGKVLYRREIDRNDRGQRLLVRQYGVDGSMESRTTYAWSGNVCKVTLRTPDGNLKTSYSNEYDANGFRYKYTRDEGSNHWQTTFYDPSTGFEEHHEHWQNGKMSNCSRMAYDSYGFPLKREIFKTMAMDKPFAVHEYRDGLEYRCFYDYGTYTSEYRSEFNEKRWPISRIKYKNGNMLARLVYEYRPSGNIIRTLGYAPDGELFAEYPNRQVWWIYDDGKPSDKGEVKFYKSLK